MNRKAWIIAAVLGAGILAVTGFKSVPPRDEEIVAVRWLGSSGSSRLEPGIRWVPPLVASVSRYPTGEFEVALSLRGPRGEGLATREGARVRVSLEATLRPAPGEIHRLDESLGRDYREPDALAHLLLEPALETVAALEYDGLLAGDPAPARTLADALRGRLERSGLEVENLSGLSVWPALGMGAGGPGDPRILLVGLDGADWKLLDPLMERGLMPNLSRLVGRGVRARLKTITPMLSPIIWTSMATGKRPEKHGIVDFLAVDSRTGRQMPVTSTMRQVRAFWQILSAAGVSVGTVGWWATWPAEEVLGFMVTDRVAYQLFGPGTSGEGLRGRTWPEELILSLAPQIQAAGDRAEKDLQEVLGRSPDQGSADESALQQILVSTRTYHHAALRLLREYRPRVAAVYYEGPDTVAHLFMRYAPPRLPGVSQEEVLRWGGVVERYYQLQDSLLGQLLEAAGDGTVVMVVSDHGFKSGSTRPQTDPRIGVGMAADWHRKFGVLVVAGPGVPAGSSLSDVSILDVTPTLLALAGLPAAEDMDGRVIEAVVPPERLLPSVATYEGARAGDRSPEALEDPAAEAVEQEIIAKLTTLGYLGQTTPNASNNIGITLLQQGRVAEAEEAFRRAYRQDPDFLSARLNIARALMASGKMNEALSELRAVREADPALPDVDNLIGNVFMALDDLEGARKTFLEALDKDPRNPHLWNSLGIVLARQGRPQEALEAYRRVEEIDSDYAEAINNAGLVYRDTGRPDLAVATFRRAIEADPDFPGSYNNLGLVHQDRGDLQAALEAYDQGLEADPENPIIWNNRGSALLGLKRLEEAREAFLRAVGADPEYASAHNNLGAVLGMLGDPEGELDEYLSAIDLDPDYVDARLNLSLALIRRGRPREGLKALEQVLELDPDHPRAGLEKGLALVSLGEEEEGLRALERVRDLEPGWPAPHNALARLHLALGRREEALREARASLSINPDQPAIRELEARAAANEGEEGGEPGPTSGSRP